MTGAWGVRFAAGPREPGRPHGPVPGPTAGITLLELVTALLIISLAVAVAVPAYLSLGTENELAQATRRVETLFRLARDSAIASGLPVTVVIDSTTELVWLDTPLRIQLGTEGLPGDRPSVLDRSAATDPSASLALLGGEEVLQALEPGQPLGLPAGVEMELPRARTRFTFQPTGAALADTLVLKGPFGMRAVTVDPWTGDVRIR